MLPETNLSNVTVEQIHQPNKTYKLDLGKKRIVGYINNLEAIKQTANKTFSTERYKYSIYSWNYGIELKDLIGKEKDFVISELKRRIEEALLVDDRIESISGFKAEAKSDSIICSFIINSVEGSFEMSTTL